MNRKDRLDKLYEEGVTLHPLAKQVAWSALMYELLHLSGPDCPRTVKFKDLERAISSAIGHGKSKTE